MCLLRTGLGEGGFLRLLMQGGLSGGGGGNKRYRNERNERTEPIEAEETDYYDEEGVRHDENPTEAPPDASGRMSWKKRTQLVTDDFATKAALARGQVSYAPTNIFREIYEDKAKNIASALGGDGFHNIFNNLIKDHTVEQLRAVRAAIREFPQSKSNAGVIGRRLFRSIMPQESSQLSSMKDLSTSTIAMMMNMMALLYIKQFGSDNDHNLAMEWIDQRIEEANKKQGREEALNSGIMQRVRRNFFG